MNGVGPIVGRQGVFLSVELELAFGNAVSIAANQSSEIRIGFQIILQIVIAKHDVIKVPLFVWHTQRNDYSAIIADLRLSSPAITQGVQFDRRSIFGFPERFVADLARLGTKSGTTQQI